MDLDKQKIARGAEIPPEEHWHPTLDFPKEFLWGTSISSHQVEGDNVHNDWWDWEKIPGHIADGSISGKATDHWHRFREDFRMAHDMGMNSQRTSIEWSRVESAPGEWDAAAIAVYREMFQDLRDRGMVVMVTLTHYTLPRWVAEQGGWEKHKTIALFERFVRFMVKELGESVDLWITINEPMVYAVQGYMYGVWTPGVKSIWRTLRVLFNLASAHKRAYRAIHELSPVTRVGIAQNVISFDAYRKHHSADRLFVGLADWLWNHSFFWLTGNRTHDFIGVNYYFHYRVTFVPRDFSHFFFGVRNENREVSDVGWELYAPGIFDVIQDMAVYKKPIYITENGLAAVNDDKRVRFLVSHLKEVYHAIRSGVDVRGYFHWALTDNFEWEKGFAPRFGLIEIDYDTLERRPRRSAAVYGEIAKANAISHDLLRFLGHQV